MNKLYRVFGIFLPSWLMLISCSQGKSIEKQLIKMSEIPIRIETEGMVACNDADSVSIIEEGNSRLKMIVWADSTECSKCYVRHLDMWNSLIKLEHENPNGIRYYFILEANPEKLETTTSMLQSTTQLKHTIYVDTAQYFRKKNPQIPSDVLFHTFLLDNDNKVVLVGDPTKNKSIQNLFKQILNENLGISINDEETL